MFERARNLLSEFKGDDYRYGFDVLTGIGPIAARRGKRALLIRDGFPGSDAFTETIADSLRAAGVTLLATVDGAAPNAPREDLHRIARSLCEAQPDVVLSFGGGSTIDAAKAAEVLRSLGGTIDDYFGTGLVARAMASSGKTLAPHVAIQTAASSAAHLTKYSNITDLSSGQKKLIVDEAIVPGRPVFDYGVTLGAPAALTVDGALDGVAHCLEVLYGAAGKQHYERAAAITSVAVGLVLAFLPRVVDDPGDREGREALALATDLGGYAIMIGGTNGAHLTSFSLIDILSHGRACAIMNPYYTVFFASAIEEPLRLVAAVCEQAGYAAEGTARLRGRTLAVAVAEALIGFQRTIGVPVRLADVPGFTSAHVSRALAAAKHPQLKMKLENMPVPLSAEMVDDYMGPVLEAAVGGDLTVIRNVM